MDFCWTRTEPYTLQYVGPGKRRVGGVSIPAGSSLGDSFQGTNTNMLACDTNAGGQFVLSGAESKMQVFDKDNVKFKLGQLIPASHTG